METKEATKKTPLTRREAEIRKLALTDSANNKYHVDYDLIVTLRHSTDKDESNPTRSFDGHLTATFTYHQTDESNGALFLNLWGEVRTVRINGEDIEPVFENKRIILQHNKLKQNAQNVVTVLYHGYYTNRGCGLVHYIDPSDKKEYLYTQFEPFDCHLLFPCFDQPDIKSALTLGLIAPDDWIVLGNENTGKVIKLENLGSESSRFSALKEADSTFLTRNIAGKSYTYTEFNTTPRISTYLFAVCAGPYYCINNPFDYHVPMKLYSRESLKNCGEHDEFFRVTIAGMEFYKDYFGLAFPYTKYDQIYCPEYNWGAMENVGLVTYNEAYCWKEPPSQLKRARLAITILHELAHQWFGNLVTMKWWDDLWLNESFATFISFLCQDKGKGLEHYTNSWLSFNLSKGMAYKEDQDSGTHPVYNEVINTEIAETHFDMIVYYKGSSILKQLYYFIGFDDFSAGLKDYFKTYAWTNTTFDQFIEKMTQAVRNSSTADHSHDLNALCNSWLKKAGLTQIEVKMEIDSNNILQGLSLHQSAVLQEHNNLQTHKCNLLFVYRDGNKLLNGQIINPDPITTITDSQFIGKEAPEAIILNDGDHAYFKWIIDNRSLNYLRHNLLDKVPDSLSKQLFLRSIYDMTRDARMSSIEYLDIINEVLSKESNYEILSASLRYLSPITKSYIPYKYFPKYGNMIFDLTLNLIGKFSKEKECMLTFLEMLMMFAYSNEHFSFLRNWLNDEDPYVLVEGKKVTFDRNFLSQDNRFSIVKGLFKSRTMSREEKEKLLEQEVTRDKNSTRSVTARHSCYSSLPDPEVKKELWDKYVNKSTTESLANMRSSMAHFSSYEQLDIVREYFLDNFFSDVVHVGKNNEHFYVEFFVSCFCPYIFASEEIIGRLEVLIQATSTDDNLKITNKTLAEARDDMKRFLKAHKLCEEYLNR